MEVLPIAPLSDRSDMAWLAFIKAVCWAWRDFPLELPRWPMSLSCSSVSSRSMRELGASAFAAKTGEASSAMLAPSEAYCVAALSRQRISKTSYSTPLAVRPPLATDTMRLSQAWAGAAVSKYGVVRR